MQQASERLSEAVREERQIVEEMRQSVQAQAQELQALMRGLQRQRPGHAGPDDEGKS